MRFNLGALLVAGAIGPPILAWLWMVFGPLIILAAIYLVAMLLVIDQG